MTKSNEQTATVERTAKGRTVRTDADSKFPTDKQLRAETEADLRRIAKETGAPRARAVTKAATELGRGITSRAAPQSAKAMADAKVAAKAAAPASNKTDKAAAKAKAKVDAKAKVEQRKAERASWSADRPYKVLVKAADCNLRDGTWTKVMVETALSHKTTAAANAALAKHREFGSRKIDWKWLANVRKYIQF